MNKPLKILHVIPSVSLARGGPSQAVLQMVTSLRAQGIESLIVTTNDDGPNTLKVSTDDWVDYHGIPIHFFPRFSPNIDSIREFAFSSTFTAWFSQNAKEYDLIHVHAIFSYVSTMAMAIARRYKIPYIVRPLGQLCEWSLQQSALKKQLYLSLIERANLNHSQGLHLTSDQERKEANKLQLTCPSFIIPHGLDVTPILTNARQQLRTHFNLPEDEKVVLFLSRLHPKKGLNYLIQSLASLTEYPFTFILAGSGSPDYEDEVRSLLKTSGLDARTVLPGFVKGKAKDLLLQGSDLYVLTSHSENFGVAVLEALAAGLPTIVTSGVALSKEIRTHNIGYVAELDKAAITSTLKRYFTDPDTAEKMGKRAQQFTLENYTWEQNANSLIRTYRSVLNQPSNV